MMDRQSFSSISLIGAGAPLWTSAAMLATELQTLPVEINVIEDGEDLSPLYTNLPPVAFEFHDQIGINEAQMLHATSGCFWLGSFMSGVSETYHPAFRRLGGDSARLDGVRLHHFAGSRGLPGSSRSEFNLAELAARKRVFLHPDTKSNSAFSTLDYGYTVNPAHYSDLMKRCAISRGAIATDVTVDNADLVLDLRPVPASVDVSGWQDCSQIVPHNFAKFGTTESSSQLPTANMEERTSDGWNISSEFRGAGIETTLGNSSTEGLALKAGYTTLPWNGKTIRLGPATGFLGAFAAQPSLLLIQQLKWLSKLLPATTSFEIEAAEFNRLSQNLFERALDFAAILDHRANPSKLHETAERMIEQFVCRGHLCRHEGDPRSASVWLDTLFGIGLVPADFDPLASAMSEDKVDTVLADWRLGIANAVANMAPHETYLKRYLDSNTRKKTHA